MTNEAVTSKAAPELSDFAVEFLDWAENHGQAFIYVDQHGVSLGCLADDPGWQNLVALARRGAS